MCALQIAARTNIIRPAGTQYPPPLAAISSSRRLDFI